MKVWMEERQVGDDDEMMEPTENILNAQQTDAKVIINMLEITKNSNKVFADPMSRLVAGMRTQSAQEISA